MGFKLEIPKYLGKATQTLSVGWIVLLTTTMLISFALGLGLVWMNIQKTNIGYTLRGMESVYRETASLNSQLEVQRDLLLSPYSLGVKAKAMGMGTATSGQLRRLP